MSARLVANFKDVRHNYQDDMESTLYVILWIMFIFTSCFIDDALRSHFLHNVLDPDEVQGSGGLGKETFLLSASMLHMGPIFKGRPALDALVRKLQKTFAARYIVSTQEEEETLGFREPPG